jgi:hypothetical protein
VKKRVIRAAPAIINLRWKRGVECVFSVSDGGLHQSEGLLRRASAGPICELVSRNCEPVSFGTEPEKWKTPHPPEIRRATGPLLRRISGVSRHETNGKSLKLRGL